MFPPFQADGPCDCAKKYGQAGERGVDACAANLLKTDGRDSVSYPEMLMRAMALDLASEALVQAEDWSPDIDATNDKHVLTNPS